MQQVAEKSKKKRRAERAEEKCVLRFMQIAYFEFVIVRTLKLKYHFDNECVSHKVNVVVIMPEGI